MSGSFVRLGCVQEMVPFQPAGSGALLPNGVLPLTTAGAPGVGAVFVAVVVADGAPVGAPEGVGDGTRSLPIALCGPVTGGGPAVGAGVDGAPVVCGAA